MTTIWKFAFETADIVTLSMPRRAAPVCVMVQNGLPCLWALVETTEDRVIHRFRLYGTGHPMHPPFGHYVGSYILAGGQLVFHVFDLGEFGQLEEARGDDPTRARKVGLA